MVVSNIFVIFTPDPWEFMIQIWRSPSFFTWLNHQLDSMVVTEKITEKNHHHQTHGENDELMDPTWV